MAFIRVMSFGLRLGKRNLMLVFCVVFLVSLTLLLLKTGNRDQARLQGLAKCRELSQLLETKNLSGIVQFHKTANEEEQVLVIKKWKLQMKDKMILEHLLLTKECPWEANATAVAQYRAELGQCCNASFWLAVTQDNAPLGSNISPDGNKGQKLPVNAELTSLLPERSPFPESQYRRCAVVGNGGILKNSRCGVEIDQADLVVRCSTFRIGIPSSGAKTIQNKHVKIEKRKEEPHPETKLHSLKNCFVNHNYSCIEDLSLTEKCMENVQPLYLVNPTGFNLPPMNFSEDVGTKTSLVTMNPSIIQNKYKSLQAQRKPFADALQPYRDALFLIPALSFVGHGVLGYRAVYTMEDFGLMQQAFFLNPRYLSTLRDYWKKQGLKPQRLSSGFMFVSMALEFCEHITLYGFWPFPHDLADQPISHHYYDNRLPKAGFHSMPSEFSHYLSMYAKGVLRLRLGKCQ